MRIAFRCDAAPAMGIGHLMRCLTLAEALRRRGAECRFLLAPDSAARASLAEARGFPVAVLDVAEHKPASEADDPPMAHWLPWGWRRDAQATAAAIGQPADWLVVDHYALDARWHAAMGPAAQRILAIDDMADRPLAADALLDHNASATPELYAPRLRRRARLLLGPRFALLRPEIAALGRLPAEEPRVGRIVVSFGGAASGAFYRRAVEALAGLPIRPLTIVAIGVSDASDRAAIEALSTDGLRTEAHALVTDLPERSAAADLCVGAAGVSALERAQIGVPSLTYVTAGNQRLAIAALARAGALIDMGDIAAFAAEPLVDSILRLAYTPGAMREMARKGRDLIPAGGADRVADALISSVEDP